MQRTLALFSNASDLRPEVVAATTRAEKLRLLLQGDLNFHGQGDASPLHTLHPFPAKYPPQLPRLFIQHLTTPGERVLDPMAGSGTTVLEALQLGRMALGSDIDPLALHLIAAKILPPTPSEWERAFVETLQRARALQRSPQRLLAIQKQRFDDATQDFVNYWFLPETQRDLMALALAIEAEPAPHVRRFLQIIFSSIIIAKSGSVAQARDLSHTRPHKIDKPPKDALEAFRAKAKRALRLLSQTAGAQHHRDAVTLSMADAQNLPLPDKSIHLIVTSPPYAANAIDYMRAHKFTLVWWGHSVEDLRGLRREYIGGETTQGFDFQTLPAEAQRAVERIAAVDARKGRVLHRYFSEMRMVLAEMARVLVAGGTSVLVVGETTMRGIPAHVPQSLAALGEQVGLQCIGIGERHIDRDRRMMPTRRGKIGTSIEKRMHTEYVLGFLKQE